MTVLRSNKVVTATQNEHSPKSSNPEIEPLTPAKQVEVTKKSRSNSSSGQSGSISNRGLRRSARLSLTSRSSDINNDNDDINVNNVVDVEMVTPVRKRKADNLEKGEDQSAALKGSGLNVIDGVEEKSGAGNVNALKLRSGKKIGLKSGINCLAIDDNVSVDKDEKEAEEKGGGEELVIVSEGGVKIEEAQGGLNGNQNGSKRFNIEEDKKKGVLMDGDDMEIDIVSDISGGLSRNTSSEKGKGKAFDLHSSSSSSDSDDLDDIDDLDLKVKVASSVAKHNANTMNMERATSSNNSYKERFRSVAKQNASRFAYFSVQEQQQEDHHEDVEDEVELPQMEANGNVEDWPGPFSTALKIIKEGATKMPTQQKKNESVPLIWVPKRNQPLMKKVPLLQDLCMAVMAENVDAITSLESVPDVLRHKLTHLLCDSRKMNHHFLDLLANGSPTEIRVRDCSWLSEEQLTETLEKNDTTKLTVLQLDQCGRCLPDYVLFTILTHSRSKFCALTNISLKGACRLSDAGLNTIVASAPFLRSINLGCCSLLTSDSINNLADKLGPVLKELYIDECVGIIDVKAILPALLKLEQLEVLSISRLETVNDSFIIKFVVARGQKMKELILADCTRLTDRALQVIAENCPELCVIDLTNLCLLTDAALGHLANGCQKIQTMKLCRNAFSDEAVAAYLETCGGPLRELSLNHVDKVAHHSALSLAKRTINLESLDLSWCREMTNEALGLIVDTCLSLKLLKLFGCTQITNVFTDGHSNEKVKIIGLKESHILKNIEATDPLPLRYSAV